MLPNITSFLTAVIFFCLSPVYRLLQRLIWKISGVQASRDAAASGACFERSVHVQKVIWRKKLTHMKASDTSDFWTVHKRFDHPKILTDPSISLYGLTSTEAVFLKTDSQVNIYSSDTHPFMKFAQANNAEMVYTIPIEAFHRLADEVGDPKLPVIWISSIGRCGSTLVAQLFEKIPGTISVSEPDAVSALSSRNKSETISKQEARRLLRSVIRLQCKTLPGAQRIVLKVMSITFAEVKDIYEMFPKIQHVFLYRNMLAYAKSIKALGSGQMQMRLLNKFSSWFPSIKKVMYRIALRIDRDDHFLEDFAVSLTIQQLMVFSGALIITRYQELWNQGILMIAVLYEDLKANKEQIVRKMFQKLDIPERYIPQALTAFDVDSQRGSLFGREAKGVVRELTEDEILATDRILERFGFPRCNEIIDLPGRIKPPV